MRTSRWASCSAALVLSGARKSIPCAAAIYADDMYVERMFSEQAAQAIGGCRYWLTNELQHDGLRADGAAVLERLIGLARGER